MNFISGFELFMGALSIGLIVFLGPDINSSHSEFRDAFHVTEN